MSSWAKIPDDVVMSDLETAIAVTPTSDAGKYHVDLKRDWCIGTVPQGGYLMAILASTTSKHMIEHQPQLDQPDMITSNFEFLGRSVVGPAQVHIQILKRGRQFSTIRAQLIQGTTKDGSPATAIEAIISQGNLAKEELNGAPTLRTSFRRPDDALRREESEPINDPLLEHRIVLTKLKRYVAKDKDEQGVRTHLGPSIHEQWVQWTPTTSDPPPGFDMAGLAFMADSWRPIPEQYALKGNWYPTLNARVEVKRAMPVGGWKWLYMRVETKVARNGRFDYEAVIFDEEGEVVALSHHTCLIVGAERNSKVKGAKI